MKCSFCHLGDLRKQANAEGKYMHVIPRTAPVVEVKFTWPEEVLDQGQKFGPPVTRLAGDQLRATFAQGISTSCICGWRGVVDRIGQVLVKKLHKLIRYR